MKRKIKLIIVLVFLNNSLYSQDTSKIISRYRIIESWHDGQDLSNFDQERKGELHIHYNQKNQLSLSNISVQSGTYSTGPISLIKADTTEKYGKHIFTSNYWWTYHNSYDNDKGVAMIHLTEEETNYGATFRMELVLNKRSKIIYKGFKIDTINEYIIPKTIFRLNTEA